MCNVCNNDIKDKSLAQYIKNEWLLYCFLKKKCFQNKMLIMCDLVKMKQKNLMQWLQLLCNFSGLQ